MQMLLNISNSEFFPFSSVFHFFEKKEKKNKDNQKNGFKKLDVMKFVL